MIYFHCFFFFPVSGHDLADISRIFCEVIHDLKSELQTPQDFASVQQQLNQLRSIRGDGQSQFIQQSKVTIHHSPTGKNYYFFVYRISCDWDMIHGQFFDGKLFA